MLQINTRQQIVHASSWSVSEAVNGTDQCFISGVLKLKTKRKIAKGSILYLKPEIVFSLICHLAMVITDVTFPDQAVDGSLVGVSAVPQHSAVVETKLVL